MKPIGIVITRTCVKVFCLLNTDSCHCKQNDMDDTCLKQTTDIVKSGCSF